MTLHRAVKARFDLHKKIARWTWPIWMYVSVTGVVIYFLLYVIFPQKIAESKAAQSQAATGAASQQVR